MKMIITPIQFRWNDFDILKHVYNGKYQQLYDIGKTDYFTQVLGITSHGVDSDEGMITASTTTNYHAPIEIYEQASIRTCVERVGNKSFTIFQEIFNPITNELKSDSRTVAVCYNPTTKETFSMPDRWRKAIAEAESLK